MPLGIYNSLTKTMEEFIPVNPSTRSVGMYCCGPTVHDFSHIGNYRTFVFADLLRRYLQFKGWSVRHVMNITDVEDKIIARIKESGLSLAELTQPFEAAFFEDLHTLNCLAPHEMPRATGHILEITQLIEQLMGRGLAYRATDGSIYFSIEKYRSSGHQYGQLVKLNFDALRPGERVKKDEYEKESPADFALWKARVPEDGNSFWPSPWGEGRPGWHIECSAMSMKILGPSFDLHLGGEDLVFPHHEDEIAQSEGAALQSQGNRFVKYWVHAAHLMVEGKKMSKSLGNFFTLRDLVKEGFTGREIRYLLLSAHYRESFNFTRDGLQAARATLSRLDQCLASLQEAAGEAGRKEEPDSSVLASFSQALDQDLNVSAAWGSIFEWIRELNRRLVGKKISALEAGSALAAWEKMNSVFAIPIEMTAEIPGEIQQLLEEREAARRAKEFKRADEIRQELKALGWIIEDTPKGPRLKKDL